MRISTTRWLWPEVSPFFHSVLRVRLKYHASPVAMVLARACAFICATISTSPVAASVATAVTSPSASNFGVSANPSSRSAAVPGDAKVLVSDMVGHGVRLSVFGAARERDKAQLVVRRVAEGAEETRSHGRGARLGDAADRHAGV